MRQMSLHLLVYVALLFSAARTVYAIEVKVSAQALERTLRTQLFNGPQGRYYIRGDATSACYVYAESPHVMFVQERIVVRVHEKARLGTAVRGTCIGVSLTTNTDVSLIPEAEEESVGFRDARIERLSESRELNFLLEPFLSPQTACTDEGECGSSDATAAKSLDRDHRLCALFEFAEAALAFDRRRFFSDGR
jgi:hypothetical protein